MKAILLLSSLAFAQLANAALAYDSIPNPFPFNVPSLGYQATQTGEFGQAITLAGGGGTFDLIVNVGMSDWALKSQWDPGGSSTGFNHPLTLNLYNDPGDGSAVNSPFASQIINAFIPWRPEADPTCPGGTAWRAGDGQCYNGSLSLVSFAFQNVTLPGNLIYGLAFSTQTWGASPLGVDGPYNSLNFGLASLPPSTGSDTVPTTVYWNTMTAGSYTDGGAGGVGTFRRDTLWSPYTPIASFNVDTATPEPGSLFLFGTGLAGLAVVVRARKFKK